MTHSQACRPCAKRKVKCDLGTPCSNCSRRKTDKCVYPTVAPEERIRRLESLVKRLGGDPDTEAVLDASSSKLQTPPTSSQSKIQNDASGATKVNPGSSDPVIFEADGQSFYLESRSWTSWTGDHDSNLLRNLNSKSQFLSRRHPVAFQSFSPSQPKITYESIRPTWDHAQNLFAGFQNRVDPLTKITFDRELHRLRVIAIDKPTEGMSDDDCLLILAIFYAGARSLTQSENSWLLKQNRDSLMSHYRVLFETLLAQIGLFSIESIKMFQAVMIYMIASADVLSTRSLWSLMGILLRSAERLGLHRDGTVLGLKPYETEIRRRMWWQLQAIDLFLSARSGATSLTLMSDWDVKLPLNIHDTDLDDKSGAFPEPRKGLTAMSFALFGYEAINQQRRIFQAKGGKLNLSWAVDPKLTPMLKESVIAQLEERFNEKFLRFCDPIKPVENLLQLFARYLIASFRLTVLHPMPAINSKKQISDTHRKALLDISIKCLQYNVAMHSKFLKPYRWRVESMFPWHALMCILVEASKIEDMVRGQEVWDLLTEIYENNKELHDVIEDRRRFHAAELVVGAWKAWQNRPNSPKLAQNPQFITGLEKELTRHQRKSDKAAGKEKEAPAIPSAAALPATDITPHDTLTQEDFTAVFDLDFQDIDWSFWETMD